MKVYHKETGELLHREAIDARELVATGEYQFENPNASKEEQRAEMRKTPGEVLASSHEQRRHENIRSQYQQFADATEVRDHQQLEEVNPAMKARRMAREARARADELAQIADQGGRHGVNVVTSPGAVSKMKAEAAEAEKRAKRLEKEADEAEKHNEELNKRLKAEEEKEAKRAEKAAAGSKKKAANEEEEEEDLDSLTKSEIEERLDKAGVEYQKSELKEDLVKKLKKAEKQK